MKRENTKQVIGNDGDRIHKCRALPALVILMSLIIPLAVAPCPASPMTAANLPAISGIRPQLTLPADDPLDADTAAAVAEALKETLGESIEDQNVLANIDGMWKTRTLAGRTLAQIKTTLFAVVKTFVTEKETLDSIWASWEAISVEDAPAANEGGNGTATTAPANPPTNPPSNPPANPQGSAGLRQYIKSLKYDARVLLAVQGDGGTLILDKEKDKKNERKQGNAKIIRCLRTTRNLSKNFEDIAILQPTQGVIYPGALVYADQELVDGKPRPLTGLPRAPIDLRLDLPGLQDEGSFTIANPTDGRVQSSVNKALNFWNNSTSFKDGYVNPSRSNYSSTIAYSSDQLAMSLGFNAKWASGDAAAQFKFSTSNEKNVVVAVYRQVFYTVTFDAPNLPEQFFDASVSADEAREAFSTEKPSAPAYVSSVNYGRIIMFRMETDKSTLAADAQAAFNYAAGAVTVGADAKLKYDKILSNSAITVVTMGGNAEVMSDSVAAKGSADLQKIIRGKNAVYSKNNPGVPIAYTVKFLKDNTIAKMGSTTDFVTEDCKELDNIWVKVIHSGAFIAHFTATWNEPDPNNLEQVVEKVRKEHGKTSGYQFKFDFPGDATNIRLKMENDTGLVWQPQREILSRVLLPVDYNKCYTVHGTTLGSGYTVKDLGTDCP